MAASMACMAELIGKWNPIDLAGHTCHVFEPASPSPHGFVVVYLHGVSSSPIGRYAAFVHEFERHGLRVIEPTSGPSWWTDRIWPEFDPHLSAEAYVMQHVVPHVAERWVAGPPQLALLGIGMGGQGALRMAYKYPNQFPTVAAISPTIDYQKRIDEGVDPVLAKMYRDSEDARQDTALLHIHPLSWPRNQFFCCAPADECWYDSAERLRMKLWSLGVPFECDLETNAGGHSWHYYCHMADRSVGFVAERLERERLRVG
jgi:S-formylglutathione hydrolase FrmB